METGKPERRGITNRWAVLALLAIGVLISFVDRTSISSTLADANFIRHFALTDVDRGWINAAFFWSYGLFQVPMGWVADRYGVKWPYAISFTLWCIATTMMGLVTTLGALVLMRLIIGVAEAIVIPASYRWIRNNFDERQNGLAVGLLAMGNKFGPALGAPIAAWIIVTYSWKLMFIVTGLAGLIWLAPWLLLVRNDLPTKADLAQANRRARTVTFGNILSSPVVWGGMITNFCYGYFTFYCMTWMPAYLVEQRGLSISRSGLFTFFSFAGIAIVAALAGSAADLIIARGKDPILVRKIFTVTGFVGGCSVLLGAYAPTLQMALFWNVFSLSLLGFVTANNLVLSRLTLIPRQAIGLVTGVQQLATSLAGGVAASLSGWLLHVSGSYDLPMMVILGFLLVGAMATIVLYRPEWSPKVTEAPSRLRQA
ncbi:MFS transporter [Paraburkholderia sprentiae WSM5005]|uniref:MFS transporter n=2 Tax=Paraburkholderia sprentiae TaxID=948107 RepID=A0A1I9YSG5_9BURK|nr:MFS transporter [Paraburkholderia sprentiae]APA89173.1 MFS transporter [Paraburkholderia sprentiae WSM5005]